MTQNPHRLRRGLLLSNEHSLAQGGGGQQQCSREYVQVLEQAGVQVEPVTFRTDRSWPVRLRRKFSPRAYQPSMPAEYWKRVEVAARTLPDFVLCNLNDFVAEAGRLRRMMPAGVPLVLLSHGLVSTDLLHRARIAAMPFAAGHLQRVPDVQLGETLRVEAEGLPFFDHVFCLAEFETDICRWLGSRSVSWWPRTIPRNDLLDWQPTGNRVGIVGTLDHPPNLEGVVRLCELLDRERPVELRLRLVTRSAPVARELAARFSFVDNLGPLEGEKQVREEAATWSAFLHPIFCHAMGCSTKVATGLGWGLPMLTSSAGLRGYRWSEGKFETAESPEDYAALVRRALDPVTAKQWRGETLKVISSAPSTADVARDFRDKLDRICVR
jgi:hypothetical protein